MKELTAGERLALLKDKHGGLKNVIKETQSTTYIVYNNDGDILYKSIAEPNMDEYEKCKVYEFKTVDTKIIDDQGKSIAQFFIEEDEHEVCHIKLRTTETVQIKSDRDFLQEIEAVEEEADYIVDYDTKNWVLEIAGTELPKQNVVIYVTPHKDPHILLERVVFSPSNIDERKIVVARKNSLDVDDFSIYTHKSSKLTYTRK